MGKKRSPDLSISLISFNTKDLVEQCLNSIFRNTRHLQLEVMLVDNASKDGTPAMVQKKFPEVKLTRNRSNELFTKAHNHNLKRSHGDYFLVLNEDIQIPPLALEKMVTFMKKHPKVGLASCRQVNEHEITDMTCHRFPHPLIEIFESSSLGKRVMKFIPLKSVEKLISSHNYSGWRRNTIREVDFIPGSFFMGRKELLDKVGFFDEGFWLFYEEPDYCKRAKNAGFLTYHVGTITITHLRTKAIAKLPPFRRYQIAEHDILAYHKKYFGLFWWLILWAVYRPDWLYWKLNRQNRSKQ